MITFIFFLGFIATMTLATLAKHEKNYGEMRTLIATGILFFCLYIERLM